MNRLTGMALYFLAFVLLGPPQATAAECTTNVTELCEAAKDLSLDRLLGDYADFGLVFMGLVGLAFAGSLVVSSRRIFKHTKAVKVRIADELREIEPGGTARLALELENPNALVPLNLLVEPGGLPDGWTDRLRTVQELRDGFRLVQESEGNTDLRIGGKRAGLDTASVTAELSAPSTAQDGDVVEYDLRFIPYRRGILRPRKARVAASKLLVMVRPPKVQITKVVHEPVRIVTGRPVATRVHLINEGEHPAHEVSVRFLLNGQEKETKVVPQLDAKAETDLVFDWTAQPGENHIRVAVA